MLPHKKNTMKHMSLGHKKNTMKLLLLKNFLLMYFFIKGGFLNGVKDA